MAVAGYSWVQQFSWWHGPIWCPIALQMSQSIAKSMANIISQLSGDLQQGGCLYKPTSSSQWTLMHSWTSDRSQKQASANANLLTFGSGVMITSYFIDWAINWQWIPFHEHGWFWQRWSHFRDTQAKISKFTFPVNTKLCAMHLSLLLIRIQLWCVLMYVTKNNFKSYIISTQ